MNKQFLELKLIRKDKNLTREQLAQLSGVPTQTIKSLELGLVNVDNVKLSTLIKLAKALKVKVRRLIDLDNAKYL